MTRADDGIHNLLIDCLAEVRAMSESELWRERAMGGEVLVIDSLEAVILLLAMEERLGRKLPDIEDLALDQEMSLDTLATLIERGLRPAS